MRKSKFNAVRQWRCRVCGELANPKAKRCAKCQGRVHMFDSKAEASRFLELLAMEQAKVIGGLEVHPRFDLRMEDQKVAAYIPDFSYWIKKGIGEERIVEDVKGGKATDTPVFKLKMKMFEIQYGIKLTIVRPKRGRPSSKG